ncbi:hypothetical protein PHMEG_000611 [Phytophthora megakarya]|uniref:Uncharacterized protein n=1 Tax=Phytophthora megakarya TaxID=4795 RepID=A0A225X382_9STRA|nr:hypothetical protein PHMEG_000611 [Phytophthora megakarya]
MLKAWVARFLRRHLVLALFLVVSSIVAAIVYEVTGGWKPKAWTYDAPELNSVDLEGPDRPSSLWRDDDFECLGWRATHNCDPYGPRDEARDRKCGEPMPRTSGYCEVRNRTSGQVLRVMLATCKSWQWSLGCALPVEVWIDPTEMRAKHSVLVELVKYYNVLIRIIQDPNASKFHAKPYAIYNSRFESVLWLDSDNIPVRDPTYLFEAPEFVKHGAIFWPDFWRPAIDTPFNVHQQSALWTLLDMPFTNMFEQESGQLLVNRSRSQAALSKLMFYSSHMPRLITDWQLVWGDKDLFRLAWLNTSTPFYMVQHLVALGGLYDEDENFFCGVSMIQRDPVGDIIFMHRNQAKLTGRQQHAIGFSIEGRGLFNKEEEAEVAKMEGDAQAIQDEEAAAIIRARERSEKQTRGIFGIVVVVVLGVWLRWQWMRRCRKSRPKLESKNSSVVSEDPSSSHVTLAVDPSSPETSGSSTAVFSGASYSSRRRNSSFQLDD